MRDYGLTLYFSHGAAPTCLPLCWSLSFPLQPVHPLCSALLGAVNMLTSQLPTCHHPSQAITVTVRGVPPGSGMNGEQKGAACGHIGGGTRAFHHSAHTDQVEETEDQGARGAQQGANFQQPLCSQSLGLLRVLFNLPNWSLAVFSGLRPTKGWWYLLSWDVGYVI